MEYTTDWERSDSGETADTISVLIDDMPVESYVQQSELREAMADAPITQLYIERADGVYPLAPRDDETSDDMSLALNSEQQEAVQIALLGGTATIELLTPFGTETTEVWSIQTYSFSHETPEGERCFTISAITQEREIRREEDGDIEILFVVEEDAPDSGDYDDGDSGGWDVSDDTYTPEPMAEMMQTETVAESMDTSSYESFSAAQEPMTVSATSPMFETLPQSKVEAPVMTVISMASEDSFERVNTTIAEAELDTSEPVVDTSHIVSTEEVVIVPREMSPLRQETAFEKVHEIEVATIQEPAPLTESEVSIIGQAALLQEAPLVKATPIVNKVEQAGVTQTDKIYNEPPALVIDKHEPQAKEATITEERIVARAPSLDHHDVQSVNAEPVQATKPDALAVETKDENDMVAEVTSRVEASVATREHKTVYRATHDQSINHSPQELEQNPTWRTVTPELETVAHKRVNQGLQDISAWEKEILQQSPRLQPSFNLLGQLDEDIVIPFEVSHGARTQSRRLVRSRTV